MTDDELPKPKGPLADLIREDISTLSAHELEARVETLKMEISRTKDAIEARGSSRAAAEALFGSND